MQSQKSVWYRSSPAVLAMVLGAAGVSPVLAGTPEVTRRLVTFSGFDAPGLPPGNQAFIISQPVIDNLGNVGFGVILDGPDTQGAGFSGLYFGQPGAVQLLQSGTPAPGLEPFGLILGNRPNVNSGKIAFNAFINDGPDPFSNTPVLYAGDFSNLKLVATRGTPVSGTSDLQFFDFFGAPATNQAGTLAFSAGIDGPGVNFGNNQGIFAGAANDVRLIARQGDAAPGITDGSYFFIEAPRLTPDNRLLYTANVEFTGSSTLGFGLWSAEVGGGTPRLVAATGVAAPGYGPGVVFDGVIRPVGSAGATTVFQGFVSGPGIDGTNFFGLFADDGPNQPLRLVARQGDHADGLSPTTQFDGLANTLVNGRGDLVVGTELRGPDVSTTDNTAIYVFGSDGSRRLVVREGDAAPGTGQTFDNLVFGEYGFNAAGQVAIYTGLRNLGDDFATDASIWIADPVLGLLLIAKAGNFIEIAPGDFRQIGDISLNDLYLGSGLEDGRESSFNELGQIAYSVVFTDGTSGVFVSQVLPAPSTGVLAILALASIGGRRRVRTVR